LQDVDAGADSCAATRGKPMVITTNYICCHGTNYTEGAVHRPIWKSMPFSRVSPRYIVNHLQDFKFKHNLQTGTLNMTGQRYKSHFDLWLINE
jgi:hypothetical protein